MSRNVFNVDIFHDVYILLIFTLIVSIIFIFIYASTNDQALILIMVSVTLLMLVLLIIHKYFFVLPFSGNDDIRFELLALNFYDSWLYDLPLNIFQNSFFYSMVLGVIYYLIGVHELIPGMFNIIFYILTLFLVYKIYLILFNNRKGIYMTLVLCGLSIFNLIFTVITLREIQITFSIILMLYFALKFQKSRKNTFVLCYLITCVIGAQFHVGLIGFILFIAIQYYFIKKGISKLFVPVLMLSLLVGILSFSSDTKIEVVLGENDGEITEYRQSNSDYSIPIGNELSNPVYSTLKVVYFLVQPFPWNINSLSGLAGFVFNIFVILILAGIFMLYKNSKNKMIFVSFLFILTCFIVFGLGTSNYGTGFRHKHKFLFLLFLFLPALTYYKEYFKGVLLTNVQNAKKNR